MEPADLPDEPAGIGATEGPATRHPPARRGAGTVLGAAMMGLHSVIYGPPKEETIVEIEASGDPPNLDTDGLDTPLGDAHRLVGPPLDHIKSRARRRRSRRR